MDTVLLLRLVIGVLLIAIHIFVCFIVIDLRKTFARRFVVLFTSLTVVNILYYIIWWCILFSTEHFFNFFYEAIANSLGFRIIYNFFNNFTFFAQQTCAFLLSAYSYFVTCHGLKDEKWYTLGASLLSICALVISIVLLFFNMITYEYNKATDIYTTTIGGVTFISVMITRTAYGCLMLFSGLMLNILTIRTLRASAFASLRKIETSVILLGFAIFVAQAVNIVLMTLITLAVISEERNGYSAALSPFYSASIELFSFGPAICTLLVSPPIRRHAAVLLGLRRLRRHVENRTLKEHSKTVSTRAIERF